jgi:hypothetical protein
MNQERSRCRRPAANLRVSEVRPNKALAGLFLKGTMKLLSPVEQAYTSMALKSLPNRKSATLNVDSRRSLDG